MRKPSRGLVILLKALTAMAGAKKEVITATNSEIAREVGLNEITVSIYLGRLEERGEIQRSTVGYPPKRVIRVT